MKRMTLVLMALLLAPPGAFALRNNRGGSTAQFLRLGAGARALGMGEAFGPIAEGADAIHWNPGGLAQLGGPELSYTHVEMLKFFHHDHIAYARPVKALKGTVAGSLTMFYQDSLNLVTNTNQIVGTFAPHSEAITFAYARALGVGDDHYELDRKQFQELWTFPRAERPLDHDNELWVGNLFAGLAMKYVQESVYNSNARTVAFDGGVLFRHTDLPQASLSFVFKNAGGKMKFNTKRENLPAEVSFGAAYNALGKTRRFATALEGVLPVYGSPFAKLGVEYTSQVGIESQMSFRAGYKTLTVVDLNPVSGATGGVGFAYRAFGIDLAFQPMAELGAVYRLSLEYRFD